MMAETRSIRVVGGGGGTKIRGFQGEVEEGDVELTSFVILEGVQ